MGLVAPWGKLISGYSFRFLLFSLSSVPLFCRVGLAPRASMMSLRDAYTPAQHMTQVCLVLLRTLFRNLLKTLSQFLPFF